MRGYTAKNKQTKVIITAIVCRAPVIDLNFAERRCTTQRWQSVGPNVGPAPAGQVVGKKLYVRLC